MSNTPLTEGQMASNAAVLVDKRIAELERQLAAEKTAREKVEALAGVKADELRDALASKLKAEAELAKERARFDWWFSKTDALKRLTVSANGCQQKWTLEQWRAAIDEARLPK